MSLVYLKLMSQTSKQDLNENDIADISINYFF